MIPCRSELILAYARIEAATNQSRVECLTSDEIVQFAQMSRFDPRLAEMLVHHLSQYFDKINPWEVRILNLKSDWPQSLCALVDIAELLVSSKEKDWKDRKMWKMWKACIQFEITKASFQAFYIGLIAINPQQSQIQIKRNLKPFSAWGYYNQELPISEKRGRLQRTVISKSQRLELLKSLIRKRPRFTVQDYIEALDHRVHRRQAERDLAGLRERLVSQGNTRSRSYSKVARKLK